MVKERHLSIRFDDTLRYKLHYISGAEGRSANGEILYLIRREIERFEKLHGEIELPIKDTDAK